MSLKIATWNVNSIKARLEHAKRFLDRVQPDVLMLQELKGLEFPQTVFAEMGYESVFVGQKAYNGVAILSKRPISAGIVRLDGEDEDDHARYIEVDIEGIRMVNLYLPNGNPAPGDKFEYKLRWMDRLYDRFKKLREDEVPFLAGGDYNIIPEPRDCYSPKAWEGDALFRPESRAKFRALLNLGLTDAFRTLNQKDHQYTFWDYFAGNWANDRGIRIDHFLTSPAITDRIASCVIDKEPRGEESPSDHTPLVLTLN